MTNGAGGATRVAVVTGAARGIGRCTARMLAAQGYAVALNDLAEPTDTWKDLAADGAQVVTVPADVSDEDSVRALVAAVHQVFGRVDVLVNNAGISSITPAEETSGERWRRVLDVNLTGPFLLSRECGRLMLEQGAGSIVNIASVAGLVGIGDRSAYNASKAGLLGLTRTLAAEWGGRGVRVNAVCPGWVKTEMDLDDQAGGGYTDDDITARVPMGRFARPEDIAAAVAFLADADRSGFVNGVALPVDGGWTADGSWETLRLRKR